MQGHIRSDLYGQGILRVGEVLCSSHHHRLHYAKPLSTQGIVQVPDLPSYLTPGKDTRFLKHCIAVC